MIELNYLGLSAEALDALRMSAEAVFSIPRQLPLEPAPINRSVNPVFFEERSLSGEVRIRPAAAADAISMDLPVYRAREVELVVNEAMGAPVTIVAPHCGWHHEPKLLTEALRKAAAARGFSFHHTEFKRVASNASMPDFDGHDAMLVLQHLCERPGEPTAEVMDYLTQGFFASSKGRNSSPARRLVLVLESTWMSLETLAAPWREALKALANDPATLVPPLTSVPVVGLPLKTMNFLQAWHLLGEYPISVMWRVLDAQIPLLPLAIQYLRQTLRNEPVRERRRDIITAFGKTLLHHGDSSATDVPHSHLIVPQNGDWGPYLLRLESLATRTPVSFRGSTGNLSLRSLVLGEAGGAELTSEPETSPAMSACESIPPPARPDDEEARAHASDLAPADANESAMPPGLQHTLPGLPPPEGEALSAEASAAANAIASAAAAADFSVLSSTLAYRFNPR